MVLEKTPESPLDSKDIKPVNLRGDQPWILGRTDAESEVPIFWSSDVKNQLVGKVLMLEKIEGRWEEGVRGWDGWMASLMQWTWTWANFGRWWGIGRPGVLQFMGLQRVGHDWVTTLNWTEQLYLKLRNYRDSF